MNMKNLAPILGKNHQARIKTNKSESHYRSERKQFFFARNSKLQINSIIWKESDSMYQINDIIAVGERGVANNDTL